VALKTCLEMMPSDLPQTSLSYAQSAREGWLGVPYRHQGRTKRGVDCLGLLVCSARDFGLTVVDNLAYGRKPCHETMKEGLLDHMVKINRADLRPGDVLYIRWPNDPHPLHLALVTSFNDSGVPIIMHADCDKQRKVVEITLPLNWWPSVSMCLRWKSWAG